MQKQQRKSARSKSKKGKGKPAAERRDLIDDVIGRDSHWAQTRSPENQRIALKDIETVLGFPVRHVNYDPRFGFPDPSFTFDGEPYFDRLMVMKWLCDLGPEKYAGLFKDYRDMFL